MPSRQQLKQLQIALISAFPRKSSLERLLYFELEKQLNEITRDSDLQDIVFNVIQTAESQGWLEELVRAAYNENSGNPLLRPIAQELLTGEAPHTPSPKILQKPNNQEQQKILLLAALPQNLRLDKQIREIEEAIKRSVKRDSFEIKIRTAVRPQDIRRALAEEKPQIVHFCGHGMEDGSLVLEDDSLNHKPVLPTGLAALFKLHSDYVKCVLLNACYSALPARAISKHINYVIGMNQPIEELAAIVFAQGFYDGLGYDNVDNLDVITRAFNEGIVAIQLENLLQGTIPYLWKFGVVQNDLSSDRSIDYTRLRDLLKANNWKEADYETYLVMLRVVGREYGDWMRDEELLSFPCTDLGTIDSLWVKYSNGRFGFSVQKKIYLEVGGKSDGNYYEEAWYKFGERFGWRKGRFGLKKEWISCDEVTFDTSASTGHLPFVRIQRLDVWVWWVGLFSRIETCKV